MKVQGAVLTNPNEPWQVINLELDEPGTGEVLVRMAFAGLCYSDEHVRVFGSVAGCVVGGHEGSGVIEAIGPGVKGLAPGDHVVLSFVQVCGHCRWCASGHSNLCDRARETYRGRTAEGTPRFHTSTADVGRYSGLGTFANYTVVSENNCVKIVDDVPLDVAALISCGVLTGWGAAVYAARVQVGDVVAVFGVGGVGINAVQGASHAGASAVIAIDPAPRKRALALALGATHAVAEAAEAQQIALALDPSAGGANAAIVCTAVLRSETVTRAFDTVGKRGIVVIAGLSDDPNELTVNISGTLLAASEKRLQGTLLGSCNPFRDIPRMVQLYQTGRLHLSELVSASYPLENITSGYDDLRAGRNIRGLIEHSH